MNNQIQLKMGQQGVVLVVGLIFMVLVTLLGVTAIQGTALEERMAANMGDRNIALQAAESALRDAEIYIISGGDVAFSPLKLSGGPFQGSSCTDGLCPLTIPPQSTYFDGTDGLVADTVVDGVSDQPTYIIELMNIQPSTDSSRIFANFRITVRAQGVNSNTVVQLQTMYKLHAESFVF
jgi:type IV pilus assembly protein PilX